MNAIDFECPECGAKAGERCHTYTGKWQPVAHAKRKKLAFEEEMRHQADGGKTPPLAAPNKESS